MSLAASYDAAGASSVFANLPSSGGVSVTVVGRGGQGARGGSMGARGSSMGARIEVSACGGSVWASDRTVVYHGASAGLGAGLRVAVPAVARVREEDVAGQT